MPTTNGHPVQTGCVAEGRRGWYAGLRVIEEAQGLGWELDAEGQAAVDAYYGGSDDLDIMEVVSGQGGIVDEAERWLNDHTPLECLDCHKPMEWRDGAVDAVHIDTGFAYCTTGGVNMIGRPQGYVWHWRDGEFFLSRICEDHDENCTDDECAGWD